MPEAKPGRGRRILLRGVIPAAAVAGAVLVTVGLVTQHSAPQAPAAAASASSPAHASTHRPTPGHHDTAAGQTQHPAAKNKPTPGKHTAATHKAKKTGKKKSGKKKHQSQYVLPASQPTQLRIPRIDVDTNLIKVGRTSSNEVGVPKGKHVDDAAWFDESPTPGQYGSSVIDGHIDTDHGRSVFYRLGALRHGDKIHITRNDGTKTTFTVDKARRYPDRHNLPADQLLGDDVDQSGLKLVTCTDFDHKTGHYQGNTVISAHLDHHT